YLSFGSCGAHCFHSARVGIDLRSRLVA
ncbi:unnamed protein product, partial [Allacma fusca]